MADVLKFSAEGYAAAAELNQPPPSIASDPLPAGSSSTSQLLRALVLAGNSGDAADNAAAQAWYEERSRMIAEAQATFPANEERSAALLAGLGRPHDDAIHLAGYGLLVPPPSGPIIWCIQPGGASGKFRCSVLTPDLRVQWYWSETDDTGGHLP